MVFRKSQLNKYLSMAVCCRLSYIALHPCVWGQSKVWALLHVALTHHLHSKHYNLSSFFASLISASPLSPFLSSLTIYGLQIKSLNAPTQCTRDEFESELSLSEFNFKIFRILEEIRFNTFSALSIQQVVVQVEVMLLRLVFVSYSPRIKY